MSLHDTGLPHSDICGSYRICRSPQLIAAYYVLLRLKEPRHPPYALNHFLKKATKFYISKLTFFLMCYSLFYLLLHHVNELLWIEDLPVHFPNQRLLIGGNQVQPLVNRQSFDYQSKSLSF